MYGKGDTAFRVCMEKGILHLGYVWKFRVYMDTAFRVCMEKGILHLGYV